MNTGSNEKKKILLVDDDEMQLTTAELFLRDEYEIHKTKSGIEALDFLSGRKVIPDIIMLDILMPNMDGWEVFKRIKAIDFLKDIPIVFLSAVEEESEKTRAYKMGIIDYITKPYNLVDLKKRIKKVIEQK